MRKGLPTHYRGLLDPDTGATVKLKDLKKPSNFLSVDSAYIHEPVKTEFGGSIIWNYNAFTPDMTNYLVPLECIFRFGVPNGSSLFERIKMPGYLESLGLNSAPKPNDWLRRPVVEYFSKLEPSDRHLSNETALNFSGLDSASFNDLQEMTLLTALFLSDQFAKAGLTLWDGKFEYLKIGKNICLGDAITPDELRLTYKGVQISKEPLRQYYHKYEKKFAKAMKEAKVIATKKDRALRTIVNDDLNSAPAKLDPAFKMAVADMYTGLFAQLSGNTLLGEAGKLAGVLKAFKKFGIA
jgi:phosphoribosylaminoimidazole-succinocarboxamide synthase